MKYRLGLRVNLDIEIEANSEEEAIEQLNEINENTDVGEIADLINNTVHNMVDYEVYDFEALWIADENENVIAEI